MNAKGTQAQRESDGIGSAICSSHYFKACRARRACSHPVSKAVAGVVQKRPFLGYRCRAETAGP